MRHPPSETSSVVIVLGAGASKDAGLPLAVELTKCLEDHISERGDVAAREALALILGGLAFQSRVFTSKGALMPDIETVLKVAEQLAHRNDQPIATYVGSWHPALERLAPNGEGVVFESIKSMADEVIHEKLAVPADKSAFKYLEELWEVGLDIHERHPPLVFTLNYDRLLESALTYLHRPFTTGFSNGLWDENEFSNADRMRIFKLHGSFNWVRHQQTFALYDRDLAIDRKDVSIESSDTNDEVIFATDNKLRAQQPFLWMFNEFDRSVRASRFIVTIGYGFADEHINEIISQGLAANESRHLVVVGPGLSASSLENARGFQSKPQRTTFISDTASVALKRDSVRKKLAEIAVEIESNDPFSD